MNVLLCEIHFNINENYILPKSCMLLLLRFTKENDKNTKGEDYREGPHSNPTSPAEQFERINHNFWFPKDINVNEDILERLSSLLSYDIHSKYFGLTTNDIQYFSEDWSECQQSARRSTFHANLYHCTMFHGACCTWCEILSS